MLFVALVLGACVPATPPATSPKPAASPPPAAKPTEAAKPAVSPVTSPPVVAQPTEAPKPAPPPEQPKGPTAAQLATAGREVYMGAGQCAICHAEQGQGLIGPALIGERASLTKFGDTARDYFDYIRTAMPQTAPGSLSEEQYLQVTTYLLLENRVVEPNTPISLDALSGIRMQR